MRFENLNQPLPEGYFAEPDAQFEIDTAAFSEKTTIASSFRHHRGTVRKDNDLHFLLRMERVHFFVPSKQYLQQVAILFEAHRKKILHLVPTAQVEHIGATSVPGLLTKGDLDLQVAVSPQEFKQATVLLQTEYSNHQLENWTESFASFKVEKGCDIPVGVQLVIRDSESDIFVKSRDLLLAQPEKLAELNQLKQSHANGDMNTYIEDKGEFFTALLTNKT